MLDDNECIVSLTIADPYKKLGWGIYEIDNQSIKIQFWASPSGGGYAAPILKGEIMNDTTFTIDYST